MHDGMPYGRIQGQGQGQGHEPIQGSRIENLQSREVDRQSPTGLIFIFQILAHMIFAFLSRLLFDQFASHAHGALGRVAQEMFDRADALPKYYRQYTGSLCIMDSMSELVEK